jgi:hypothetical protein
MAFEVRFATGVCLGYPTAMARAATAEGLMKFAASFTEFGTINSGWELQSGRYVVSMYDWCECWFARPPIFADIFAPTDFAPEGESIATITPGRFKLPNSD